jgi:hypothetical protein
MLRPADALMIPFSLLWGGFAIFWEATVIASKAPFFFKLWGIPFVVVGLYLIVGRFFADSRQRSRTTYAVTNERVVIISGLFKETVKSLALKTIADLSLSERPDGSGTVTLGPSTSFALAGWPSGRQQQAPALEGIANARSVYEIIRRAQNSVA